MKRKETALCLTITNIQDLSPTGVASVCDLNARTALACVVPRYPLQLRLTSRSTKTPASPALTCNRTSAAVFTKTSGSWAFEVALFMTASVRGRKFLKTPSADTTGGKPQNPRSKCSRFFRSCGNSMSCSGT